MINTKNSTRKLTFSVFVFKTSKLLALKTVQIVTLYFLFTLYLLPAVYRKNETGLKYKFSYVINIRLLKY